MFSRFKPFGKVPPMMLAPGLPEHAQKGELYESAAVAMRTYRSRNVLRRRALSDDPEMAAVPIGCREGVLVSPVGRVRVTDQGVQGCGSAWKRDPGSGVIGVEKGPLIPVV